METNLIAIVVNGEQVFQVYGSVAPTWSQVDTTNVLLALLLFFQAVTFGWRYFDK